MRVVLYAVSTPHASEVVESLRRLDWEVAALVQNRPDLEVPAELSGTIAVEALPSEILALPFAVPQTDPGQRRAATDDARARGFTRAISIVDPTATLASTASLADGCYVGAGAVIGAGTRLGEGALVNRSASIAHHVTLGAYATTGPAVVLAGGCTIESEAFIGAGAVVAPELRIGAGTVVGAGAVVIRDVPGGEVVVGNPARVLRPALDGP